MKSPFHAFCTAFIVILSAEVSCAQDIVQSKTGMEVANYKTVPILMEFPTEQAQKIGLTSDRISARVNLELRKHGLKGVDADPKSYDHYLYVVVHVNGAGFAIHLAFSRRVSFVSSGIPYAISARTWGRVAAGATERGSDGILQTLAEGVEFFASDYLKTNDK